MSPHLGDLEDAETLALWERTFEHYVKLFGVRPRIVVSDLHPDYLSTRLAEEIAEKEGLLHLRLQHHAAHAYAALGVRAGQKALAVVLDGAGLGLDGTIWGGEILLLEGEHFRRVGSLEPFLLPGGEAAEREPWRVALAFLRDLYGGDALYHLTGSLESLPEEKLKTVWFQIERKLHTPLTSSAGRLFEIVAVLLGLGWRNHYEGELALRLESLASRTSEEKVKPYAAGFSPESGLISGRDLILSVLKDLKRGIPRELIALRFHLGLSGALVRACRELARRFEVREVCLSGGCFQNAVFLEATLEGLMREGLKPVFSEEVPPNDGGVSYGQAVWASLANHL
ncbi:carbamoyltransferase HypF [Thermosulfurimonas dismutans]|uniref:[NiFe] hydrogenase metallocenter assembly protein HypF n=1 Tax=Thermosulfurimonas dismutans TaxID=999894 RepID=A0A179D5W6_9BACT|nr:carbamoyltransferase HypF [Thermosulfurimonas dismutans]OAQ20998.1 [NiFe] hydrogenase metallocenter assembly protein HypF [Thermosulfurimonas dismutans]